MKKFINYVKSHKRNFVFIICTFLFVTLQADGCFGGSPLPDKTTVKINNNSSVAVKGVILCGDFSSNFMLNSGSNTETVVSCTNGSFSLIVRPVEDWLSFAKGKRDVLISKLADAKATGNAADIAAITNELEAIQTKISSLEEHGGKASCTGTAIGDTQIAEISDGLYTYTLAVLCHTYAP